ncbi:hypothetical protein PENTCL1PPCAC_3742, partial [Pristionchus entomophagus]
CNSVYRTANGHVCGKSIYCDLCEDYTNTEHDCSWPEFTTRNKEVKEKEFRLAFYDIETMLRGEKPEGGWDYLPQHYATSIALCKICYKCENRPVDEKCDSCGTRKELFNYEKKDEDEYTVREQV